MGLNGQLSNPQVLNGTLSNEILRGYSAYQIAVMLGFEGTEAEWIESLRGGGQVESGGYYTLDIINKNEDTIIISFIPSEPNMDAIPPKEISLPQGKDGKDGLDGKDGIGIQSVEQTTTSTEDGGENVVTVTLTNGQKSTFTVRNGSKGNPGTGGGGDIDLSDYATKEEVVELSQEIDDIPEFGTAEFLDGYVIADADGNIGMHVGSKDIWNDLPYNRKYGFGGYPYGNGELPPFSRVAGILEADMLSVRGGKGRWNGEDTENFEHGGHLFEGWNKEEDVRLTAGIGLHNKNIAWLQTFHPANEEGTDGGAYYGITKIGSDLDGQGCDFLPSVTLAQSAFVLWNRPTDYIPRINPEQLQLLVDSGEISSSIVNVSEGLIYGAMYFDTTMQKVRVYTRTGWKTLKFEEE